MLSRWSIAAGGWLLAVLVVTPVPAAADAPFRITVLDGKTGRGVPLVRLTTTDEETFLTDSNGIVALEDPGLMGETVWFSVSSFGYEFDRRDFGGQPGFRARITAGGETTVELERTMVAQRLYRKTGRNLYDHSSRVGAAIPIRKPHRNAGVMGQDSVVSAVYRSRVFWFYGDTLLPHSRFGVFQATGGTSPLPHRGGLPPERGVNHHYFTDQRGYARAVLPVEKHGQGPVWINRLMVLEEDTGEAMYAHFSKISPGKFNFREKAHGIARWNRRVRRFVPVRDFPLTKPFNVVKARTAFHHTVRVREDGREWFYFSNPYPHLRVPADPAAVLNPDRYQVFTPFEAGQRWDTDAVRFDRREDGIHWDWKPLTAPLTAFRNRALLDRGRLDRTGSVLHLTDARTGKPVLAALGSVYWNAFRNKWIMITNGFTGRTPRRGTIWYAEADTLLGPWSYARTIARHGGYSLYRPRHHPFFDREEGRIVFFEGTFSSTWSDSGPIPRYDYNQLMYRLDLADTRLFLPAPIYRDGADPSGGRPRYGTYGQIRPEVRGEAPVPFYALPPNRAPNRSIPIWEVKRTVSGETTTALSTRPDTPAARPAFYALPEKPSDHGALEPLYEYRTVRGSDVTYTTPSRDPGLSWARVGRPLGYVWKSPRTDPPRSPGARPVLNCRGSSAHCPAHPPSPGGADGAESGTGGN